MKLVTLIITFLISIAYSEEHKVFTKALIKNSLNNSIKLMISQSEEKDEQLTVALNGNSSSEVKWNKPKALPLVYKVFSLDGKLLFEAESGTAGYDSKSTLEIELTKENKVVTTIRQKGN